MRRMFVSSSVAIAMVCGLGFSLAANEKPTEEYVSAMKSIGATRGAVTKNATAKDYDALAKDAGVYKAEFAKVVAFWTGKKADDAIGFARAAAQGAADLEAAARAKNDDGIAKAVASVNAACGSCHSAHRESLPDKTYEIK